MYEPGQEGTITLWMIVDNGQWIPGACAKFPPFNHGTISVEMHQTSKDRFQVVVNNLFGQNFKFAAPLPKLKEVPNQPSGLGFFVAVRWSYPTVEVVLNDQIIGERKVRLH